MLDLFKEVLPSLLQNKKHILNNTDTEKDYKSFIVNLALSKHNDCILYVNEMNKYPHLDAKLQYDFYFHSLVAKKRPFQKWDKNKTNINILAIKEYFNFSNEKAKEALKLLNDEQINNIKEILCKGGKE